MPSIRDSEPWGRGGPIVFKPPVPEKKGVMCTVCNKVHWGPTNIGQLNKCRKCGNTDLTKFINVSSSDFNKFSGRCLVVTMDRSCANCIYKERKPDKYPCRSCHCPACEDLYPHRDASITNPTHCFGCRRAKGFTALPNVGKVGCCIY